MSKCITGWSQADAMVLILSLCLCVIGTKGEYSCCHSPPDSGVQVNEPNILYNVKQNYDNQKQ